MHDIARAAADSAEVPDFATVLRRGERRRNARNGTVAGVAALVVAAIVGATQLAGSDGRREPDLAPRPPEITITETTPATDAAAIIDDPDAQVAGAAAGPNGATAVLWRVVGREPHGLAVSDDGFATRTESRLPIPGTIVPAGDGFILRDEALSRVWVVSADGERRRVDVGGVEGPVVGGEVAVAVSEGLVAVDPATATAHPVPSPVGTYAISSYGGRLSGLTNVIDGDGVGESTYHWSDDGGATWQSTSFESGVLGIPELVPTAAGEDHVVLMLGDGATIGPLEAVLTMPAEGDTFTRTDYDGETASQSGAWVVDGELRMFADLWGDGSGPPRASGLFRWADGRLERMASEAPEVTDTEDRELVGRVGNGAEPVLWAAVADRLYESTDGGLTWIGLTAR